MTDEEKKVVEVQDEDRKCCKCCEIAKEFFLRAGAVFLGVLLALLVAASLLKPKAGCPCHRGMMGPRPGVERQMPQQFGMHKGIHKHNMQGPDAKVPKFQKGDIQKGRPDFQRYEFGKKPQINE